jgi:hypothetical protein
VVRPPHDGFADHWAIRNNAHGLAMRKNHGKLWMVSYGSQNPVESSAKSCFADVDTMDTSRFVSPKSFPRRCLDWHLWHLSGEA